MGTRENIPALTGLRGIAVLLVVATHYAGWSAPFSLQGMSIYYLRAVSFANFGMTLFFTLSGWVITYHYLAFGWRDAPGMAFLRFVFLRLSRLYPVLILWLVLTLRENSILTDWYKGEWLAPTVMHFLSLQSWYPVKIQGQLVDSGGYSLSWSISTEIGMYVMFACALMIANRFRRAGVVLAIGAAAYVVAMVVTVHYGAAVAAELAKLPALFEPVDANYAWRWFWYDSPYFRFTQFIMGGGAAWLIMSGWDTKLRPLLGALSAVALACLMWLYWRWVGYENSPTAERADMMQAACFAILMANARAGNMLNRILSSRVLLFFGAISYSLYLFQGYAARIVGGAAGLPFSWPLYGQYLFNFALALTFSSALAWGLYKLIEMPAQRWLRQFLPQTGSTPAAARTLAAMPAE